MAVLTETRPNMERATYSYADMAWLLNCSEKSRPAGRGR